MIAPLAHSPHNVAGRCAYGCCGFKVQKFNPNRRIASVVRSARAIKRAEVQRARREFRAEAFS